MGEFTEKIKTLSVKESIKKAIVDYCAAENQTMKEFLDAKIGHVVSVNDGEVVGRMLNWNLQRKEGQDFELFFEIEQ